MKFSLMHRISVFALALIAVAPLIQSEELSAFLGPVFAALWILGWVIPQATRQTEIFHIGAPVISVLTFFFQSYRIAKGEHMAVASIEFAVLLLGIKLCTNLKYRDFQQTVLLSFVALIASTVTSYTLSYAFYFIAFAILLPVAMTLTLLRKELEQRFVKADEKTQQRLLHSKRIVHLRHAGAWGLFAIALMTGVVLIFALLPRPGIGMGGGTLFGKTMLGFTTEVQIGDLSKESRNETVYLRLLPMTPAKPQPSFLPLKFRGAVFDTYEKGTWKQTHFTQFRNLSSSDGIYALYNHLPSRQLQFEIMQEPTNPSYLFLPLGTHHIQMERTYRRGHMRFQRLKKNPLGMFSYDDGKRVGVRYRVTIDGSPPASDFTPDMTPFLQVPEDDSRIRKLAQQWARGAHSPEQKIERILQHLQAYGYTRLISAKQREESVETAILQKFLFEYKKGTCEHFATGTTILLRMLGIPARFVTGFSGARWNPIGEYYTVDADSAHAWTEVFVNGYWQTIDATPPARPGQTETGGRSVSDFMKQFRDTLAMRWHQYVIDYNETAQRSLLASLRPTFAAGGNRSRSNVRLPHVLLFLVMVISGFAVYRMIAAFRRRKSRSAAAPHRAPLPITNLFLQMEKQLRPLIGERRIDETPGRYLAAAQAKLPHASEFLQQFASHYAAARFGGIPLSAAQTAQYRQWIRTEIRPAAKPQNSTIKS